MRGIFMSIPTNQTSTESVEKIVLKRRYVNTKVAAEILGLSPGTLGNLAWKKIGPKHYIVNRRRIYALADLEDYIQLHPILTADQR
jgi:hypothetical protein